MFAMHIDGEEFEDPQVVLLETVGAAQAPDWEPDEKMVAAIEHQLNSLRDLRDDILASGGMNRQFAMEAHRLLPEMQEKYPAAYFTNQTTGTLYKPALEELHAGIWALIGAASLAIAAMIWKFVRWVIRKWKGDSSAAPSSSEGKPSDAEIEAGIKEATQAAQAKVHQAQEVGQELREATTANAAAVRKVEETGVAAKVSKVVKAEGKNAEDHTTSHVDSFEDAAFMLTARHMGNKYDDLVNQTRNSWYDILHEGRWTKIMLSLGPILSSIEQQLMQRVQVFESIFSVTQTQGDPVRHKTAMDLAAKATEPIKLPGTNYHSLEQLSRSLDRPDSHMAFNAGKEKLKPVVASESIDRLINSSSYKSLLQSRVKFIEKLTMFNKAQIKLGEISNKWNASHPGQGVGVGVPRDLSDALSPATNQLKKDLLFMMSINVAIEHFLDEIDSLNVTLATWWNNVWTAIEHYAVKTSEDKGEPKIEMPEEVEKAKGMMTLLRRAMGKVPASSLGGGLARTAKELVSRAVSAGAAPQAGHVQHPKNAVAPGMGNRQIPTKEWQSKPKS